jgi:hypothetical protein
MRVRPGNRSAIERIRANCAPASVMRCFATASAFALSATNKIAPSVAGTWCYGAASAGYRTSIGRIERFPDGIRNRAGANNRRLGHD